MGDQGVKKLVECRGSRRNVGCKVGGLERTRCARYTRSEMMLDMQQHKDLDVT